MQENYLIHILGRQEIDGEKDEIKLDTVGRTASGTGTSIFPTGTITTNRTRKTTAPRS